MIDTDASEVFINFEELTYKELGKALKSGLRKALRVIQRTVKQNLRKDFAKTNKVNPKYNDTLESGVRVTKIWVNQNGDIVGKVRIDSTKKSGSGSFRLHILEGGNFRTKPRYAKTFRGKPLKKPRMVGDISPSYFFKKGVDSNEQSFNSNMIKEVINKAVEKINNGK